MINFHLPSHPSVNFPVCRRSSGEYLGGLIRPSQCTVGFYFPLLLSSLKMSVKLQKFCLDWTRTRCQKSNGLWWGMCTLSCLQAFLVGRCLWRRATAVSGDPSGIPITWEGMQRKLQLSVRSSDSLPSLLCPGLAEQCQSLHSSIAMGMMMLICGGGRWGRDSCREPRLW